MGQAYGGLYAEGVCTRKSATLLSCEPDSPMGRAHGGLYAETVRSGDRSITVRGSSLISEDECSCLLFLLFGALPIQKLCKVRINLLSGFRIVDEVISIALVGTAVASRNRQTCCLRPSGRPDRGERAINNARQVACHG